MTEYLVDNGKLQAKSPGLGYRFSKQLEDKDKTAVAKWGSTVTGVDEGDGWLKVAYNQSMRYLPFTANGVEVLTLQDAGEEDPPEEEAEQPGQSAAVPETPAAASPIATSPSGSPKGGAVGYVFMCGNETQRECASLGILGAAQFELAKMRRHITTDTLLFLFNFESLTLTGLFAPVGEPERDLVPGAFGGKFSAHVQVVPLEAQLREARVERRVVAGPKSAMEVEALKALLEAGEVLAPDSQDAWSSAAAEAGALPPAKKQHCNEDGAGAPAATAGSGDSLDSGVLPRKAKSPPTLPTSATGARAQPQKAKSAPTVSGEASPAKAPAVVKARAWQGGKWQQGGNWQKGGWGGSWQHGGNRQQSSTKGAAPAVGYVFLCGKGTVQECQANCLFGSPQWELGRMKRTITAETKLFLFNFDSNSLIGPFTPVGSPERELVPGAFGGRFSAQLRVAPAGDELREANMGGARITAGAKPAAEVDAFMAKLQEGEVLPADAQEAWKAASADELPPKRARVEESKQLQPPKAAAKLVAKTPMSTGKITPLPAKAKQPVAKVIMKAPQAKKDGETNGSAPPGLGTGVASAPPQRGARGGITPQAKPTSSLPGYLFMCGKATYQDCESNRLFGSPPQELAQMKRFITAQTKLFLFNFDGSKLLGPFSPVGQPEKDIVPGAFGGKFQAHLRVAPLEAPLQEAKLNRRVGAGPKSATEVQALLSLLQKGQAVSPQVQDAWGPPAEAVAGEVGELAGEGAAEESVPLIEEEEEEAGAAGGEEAAATPAAAPVCAAAPPAAAAPPPSPADGASSGESRMPLGSGALRALSAEARADLEADLTTLAETFRVAAELVMPDDGSEPDGVVLRGDAGAVSRAQEELQGVLQFYGVAPAQS